MLLSAWCIAQKDLRLLLFRGTALVQVLLLGMLLIVLFSLSQGAGEPTGPAAAATLFWLSSTFCQVIMFNALFALEEDNAQRVGLLLAPMPPQAIWLGKAAAGFVLLLVLQGVFLLASIVFLAQTPGPYWFMALPATVCIDLGIAVSGALIGALAQGQTGRDSLCSILLFPLLLPLLLAGVHTMAAAFSPELPADLASWTGIALAFDGIFLAAGLVLFPFAYGGE